METYLFFIKVFKRLFQQANRLENQVDVQGYQHNGGKPSSVLDPSMIGELTHQLLVTGEMTIGMMTNGKAILRNTCDAVSNPSILASLP